MKTGRNDACPCGSGKKYKQCHMAAEQAAWSACQASATAPPQVADGGDDNEDLESIPTDFEGLRQCVEEEIEFLIEDEESDLDIMLPDWLASCKTAAHRDVFEKRLADLRKKNSDAYLRQGGAFLGLLRVSNALDLERPAIVRAVMTDADALRGDDDNLGLLLTLLAFHGQDDMLGLAGDVLLQGRWRKLAQAMTAWHGQAVETPASAFVANVVSRAPYRPGPDALPALCTEWVGQAIGSGMGSARALLTALELEALLSPRKKSAESRPGWSLVPEPRALKSHGRKLPSLLEMMVLRALPSWLSLLLQHGVLSEAEVEALQPVLAAFPIELEVAVQTRLVLQESDKR